MQPFLHLPCPLSLPLSLGAQNYAKTLEVRTRPATAREEERRVRHSGRGRPHVGPFGDPASWDIAY